MYWSAYDDETTCRLVEEAGLQSSAPSSRQRRNTANPSPFLGSSLADQHHLRNEEQVPDHPQGFSCVRCGACCRAYVQVTERDLIRWASLGRRDILDRVAPAEGWIEPVTRGEMSACPFLHAGPEPGVYRCRIYDMRPEACRAFPASTAQAERIGCGGVASHSGP
jgi:Fe-S-cluster containining protein